MTTEEFYKTIYPLGKPLAIFIRHKGKEPIIKKGVIDKLLLRTEIEQASINAKHVLKAENGKTKFTTSWIHLAWSKKCKQQIGWELMAKSIIASDYSYFAIRTIAHTSYNSKGKITGTIADEANHLKGVADMLEDVFYENDKVVMFSQSEYSEEVKPYDEFGKPLLTLEVYSVRIKDDKK